MLEPKVTTVKLKPRFLYLMSYDAKTFPKFVLFGYCLQLYGWIFSASNASLLLPFLEKKNTEITLVVI